MEGLKEWLTSLFRYSLLQFQDKSRERELEMTLHPRGETKAEKFIWLKHELINPQAGTQKFSVMFIILWTLSNEFPLYYKACLIQLYIFT